MHGELRRILLWMYGCQTFISMAQLAANMVIGEAQQLQATNPLLQTGVIHTLSFGNQSVRAKGIGRCGHLMEIQNLVIIHRIKPVCARVLQR